ncbi:RNA 2'-phosphotransferase [Seohaeicola nanhaiensis]|uniref:RNA 2'-phosphotransferase n=1 Tax=Seohaeicola nanhaiensis TaxID=1387282 RepID=A0ABV9KBR3_9RHOB
MSAGDEARRLSKVLSLILRHDPGRIGLSLDAGGWARIA